MVTEWLLDMLEAVVDAVLGLLPDWTGNVAESWGMVLGHLGDLNYYLPIAEVFAFTFGIMILFPVLMGVSFSVWLLALLRGGSARG